MFAKSISRSKPISQKEVWTATQKKKNRNSVVVNNIPVKTIEYFNKRMRTENERDKNLDEVEKASKKSKTIYKYVRKSLDCDIEDKK